MKCPCKNFKVPSAQDMKGYAHKASNYVQNTENGVLICVLPIILILALIIRISRKKKKA